MTECLPQTSGTFYNLAEVKYWQKIAIFIPYSFHKPESVSMNSTTITEKDRKMAQQCLECPVCTKARKNQKGFFYWFVKTIEGDVCPFCKAYEKVYGKKAHEPLPG